MEKCMMIMSQSNYNKYVSKIEELIRNNIKKKRNN